MTRAPLPGKLPTNIVRSKRNPLYFVWVNMLSRCDNPKNKNYVLYGDRGISVCEDWYDFKNFVRDMWPRPEGYLLDRIDNNGPYCLENCKWSTAIEQQSNTRKSRLISHNGKTLCARAWARHLGIGWGPFSYWCKKVGYELAIARILPPEEDRT